MVVPARIAAIGNAPAEDVCIVSGEVRMQPDGSVIDRGNSDSFIVVCDSEGNYHATSPERLESVGEAVTPEQWAKTMSNVAQEQPQETGVGNNENDRNNGSDGGEPMRGEGLAQGEEPAGYDVQGNPVDGQGRLVVESVGSMDEITDGDFESPTRNVQLPDLPENVAAAIGSGGKPIVIKKSVFEKNRDNHPEIDAAESRSILERALYNPDLVGSVQARRRPDYRVAIQTGDRNAVVVLDIYESKDNTEIVGWREINERGLERMRRQAAKDDGQLIILSPSDKSGSAAALSTLQDGLSSVGKGSENGLDAQGARASALSRVPTDAKGEPMFEQAEDAATAWDALVEYSGGDVATAKEIAAVMAQEKRNEYERARKLKPKGKTPAEILASKRDIAAEQSRTQLEYERWRQMAEVERGREAVAEREREAVARRAAAEQAERERAERAAQAEADRLRLERLNGVPDWRADTPEHARARGYRRSGPEVVERQGAVEAVRGKDVRVKFAKDTTADGVAAVIDVDDLQPSHVQGNRNVRHFIPEAQPKDRKDAVSKVSAQDIARDIRPEEITGSITAYTGAPSVNGRGETIQGNSRADALKWMYDNAPEQAARYKAYLIEHAADFGMDAADIEAMERPVLVNMLDVSDGEAIRLGQYVQADTESGGVERIRGRAAARKMGADMREYAERLLSSEDEDASISQLVAANGVKTLQWMNTRGYITDTQYASCFDRKGELTGNAAEDLKDVLYQGIFEGGSVEIEEMFAKLPAKVQRAILATAYRDYDSPEADSIRGEIQQAIVLYNEMMMYPQYAGATNIESALTAVAAWSQQYAFDDASGESYLPAERFSNFALHLAAMYKGMSQRGLQKMFNDLYDTIQGVGEDTLFESVERTPHTIAEAVKKVLGIDYKPVNERNNGETGNVPMADDSEVGQGGGRGSTTDVGSRERVAGTGRAYERGAGASDDSRGSGKGREIKPSEVDGRFIGRSLSESEAADLVGRMEASAEVAPTVELTPENWLAQFGEDGMVDTPIGVVKMGENQFIKMYSRGRAEYFGMVYPTLSAPDVVLEEVDPKDGSERDSKYLFVKTFVKADGTRIVHFESVTVKKDGMEVSISSHEIKDTAVKNKMQNDKILHLAEKLSPGSEWRLTETPSGSKRPDLVPASDGTSLRGKDTTKSADVQGKNDNIVGGQGETPMSAKIKTASAEVNAEPTEAQKEAGNYKKGHVQVGTFDITIEQPQGSVRKGTDADGKQWESKMNNTYGYIRGAVGVDGDHIDVFLSNDIDGWNGRKVFVVDQYNPDGSFDEHKVMLGFNDQDEAKGDYLANYEQGWENGRRIDITGVNLEDFEKWIESSKRKTKPFGEYSSVKKDVVEEKNGGSGLNGRTGNTGSNGENENNGSKAAEIAHLEELLEKPGADKKLVRAEIARLRGEGQKAAKPKRESVFQQAERVAKGARDKREGAKNVGYDAETKKWKGIPSGDIVATSAADKAGIITGYTRDPRIVSVHSTKTGRTWLEVDVFDDNAETPVRIIEALEEEGYEIEGRGDFSTVNFDNYNDAKAFSDHVREVQKRVDAEREGAEEGAASRKLSAEEVAEIIGQIELQAEIAPEIELTIENWDKLFGEDGIVSTPIGDVKMGKNQFAKLMRDGRNSKLGMLKPTLETPTIIIEDTSEAKPGDKTERGSSYIFIKGFTKANGTRLYFFTSVTVSKDGKEVVVSNQEKSRNRISRLIQEGNMLWRTPKDATAPSAEGQGLDYAQPIEAETATKGSGITPQSIPSEGKGTTKSSNVQGKDGKEEEVEVDADQAAKLRKSPGFELSTKKVKGKVTVNPKDYAPWRKTAEDNKRPQLRGVHYEEGLAMATDTASIIMVRSKYPTAWEGKTIGWDGKALDFEHGYVPWRELLSMRRKAAYAVDAAAFKAAVEQARADEASGEFNVSDYAIGVPYHGGKIYIALKRAELLADLLDNVKHGELRLNGTGQYLCLSGDGVYSIHMGVSKESLSYGLGTHVVDIPSGGVKQSKADGAVAEGVEASEAVLRDAVIGRLREAGVEVVTDVAAGQKVLDEANEETGMSNAGQQQVRLHARLSALTKAANTIRGWLDGNKRGKTFTIELPEATQRMIRKVMGRDFDSHNITANGVVHAQKNHGVGGRKLNERSIPLTTVDMELMPYIMTAPDYVRRGSDDMSGRVSVRFYKELGNGYVVVAEKEYKNSPDDMETITMWAEMSDKATNAQREAALDTHVQNAILDIDAAKIRRDAENAIENDIKIREHRVYHGSGADFESFDHSHMGTGEGAQVFGWGTYVTEVEGIGRGYATKIVTNNSTNLSSIARQHNAKRFLKKYPTFEAFKAYVDETRPDKSDIALNYYNQKVDDAKGQRHLYTVEIPEDTGENYIDHDKGLTPSQATRVRTALEGIGVDLEDFARRGWRLDMPFEYVYNIMIPNAIRGSRYEVAGNVQRKASEFLSQLGFTGIKYPAEYTSGGRADGAKNYVIFDDKDLKITDHVRFFRTGEGEAYGFTVGGKIYIDPRIATAETPVHEYAHLWAEALRCGNAEEWSNVVGLMKDTPVWDEVRERYPELESEDEIADEVIATYSGRRGAERLREEAKKVAEGRGSVFEKAEAISALERVKQALARFWKGVCDFLHIRYTSAEEVADRVMKDMLDGVNPREVLHKNEQNAVIQRVNPMEDDYHTGVRGVEDIRTLREAIAEARAEGEEGGWDALSSYPDVSNAMLEAVLRSGRVRVYSSKPIEAGVFVTPSRMQAEDYAGGGKVYSKEVSVDDVAWLNTDEGQLADVMSKDETGMSNRLRFQYVGENGAEGLEAANARFNAELELQIDGKLPIGHVYKMGRPSEFLRAAGIPNLPIELPASQLSLKASSGKHDFDLQEVRDLPKAIANPIATFAYGDKGKSQNILTLLDHNGEKFLVGIFIRPTVKGRVLEVNSIRNVFPKNSESIVRWILDGKLTNANKKELLAFLDQQRTNLADVAFVLPAEQAKQGIQEVLETAAKVVENFENPKVSGGKDAEAGQNENNGNAGNYGSDSEAASIVASAKEAGTYMKAPNGRTTRLTADQWVSVRTRNFKRWFGDWENEPEKSSKVVDENGEPMVVYHGRSVDFNTFERHEGSRYTAGLERRVVAEGYFFTPDEEFAETYARNAAGVRGGKADVIACFLNIRRPMDLVDNDTYAETYEYVTGWEYTVADMQDELWSIMDEEGIADKIKSKGYDGVMFAEELNDAYEPTKISYCILDANQAKYAEGNNGDYSKMDADMRYRTSEELDSEYGRRWLDEQTNSDGRHTTQVKNTLSSYQKFGEWVKREARGREVDVLDASSGLGIGTEWMRDNGIKVEDVEPYPSERRAAPTYKSYGDIKKKYDYIISNAVLNVIPDDWRAGVLHDMADKLKDGGRMVLNVRSAESIRRQGKEGETRITLDSPSEILVLRPDGSIKAYQKGFTKSELKEWCEKELGAGYKVEIANKGNAGGSYDTAVVVTKNNESGTVGVASETGRPSRSAQAVSNSGAKVGKKSEYRDGLEEISDRLDEKAMGAHEFLYNIAKAFGLKGAGLRASFYQDLGNSVGIRVSDHSANTDNIASKNANSEVYGLVVKLGRHRFKSNADADYLEYVYYPDRLDGARQKEIVDGLKGFVDSGDYTLLPKPDRVNRSGWFEVAESGFSDENNGNNEKTGNNSDPEVMTARARELAELLNTPVRIIRTEEEVAALPSVRQRRMKGSFNPMTGEVTIVVPNNANMADIENTFVHEVVGHDGLRVLFPDEAKLNNALDELYRVSKDEIRGTIDRMAQKMYDAEVDRIREKKRKEHVAKGGDANASYYTDMAEAHAEASKKREQFKRDATEEYGADLAGRIGEGGFEKMSAAEQTFWGRLKAMLQKALQRLLDGLKIRSKRQWGDKEWAFVLHEAFKRKRNGGRPTIFDMADTEVMRRKTGFGEMSNVESYGRDGKGNQKETVNLQYGKRLGQNQSGEYRRPEGSADGREVDTDASRRLAAVSDRSDIRVFEEGHSAHREQHIDDSQRYRREAEGERLVAIAKANGLFIPREKIKSFGERVSKQSRESEVYINFDESRVYKVKNPYAMAGSWYKNHIEAEDAIYEYLLHNKYFPETAYKFEGIAEDVDGVRIVLSQPLIKSRRTATNEEVKAYLESKGFRSEPPYFYTNDDVWVSDFNGDNALIGEDGQVYLIDPVIDIDTHKTMKDLIGDSDRDGGIKFRDGDDGLGEAIAQMKEAASLANADNRQTKEDAMKAIGGNLSKLRQAMARQRGYDLSTVKSITDLVKRMLENGLLDDLGKAETKRILSTAANVTGREDTSKYVQKVMDIMVDNQLRRSRDALGRLLSIRGKRVDGRGIEVQGALDANGVAVLQAFKKSKGLDWATIDERISDAFNRMSSEDDALAEEATLEYSGLVFASVKLFRRIVWICYE